jgi:hypothetical protein
MRIRLTYEDYDLDSSFKVFTRDGNINDIEDFKSFIEHFKDEVLIYLDHQFKLKK